MRVFGGGLGQNSQPLEARGSGGGASTLGGFCNFSIKITHFYAYFGQNSYFKAINNSSIKSV